MTLNYEEEGEVKLPVDCEGLAKKVIEASLDYVECPYEAEVNLLLTTDEEIHQMNKEHRGIDRPTDVLSFPMLSYEKAGDFAFLDEESDDDFNPDTGEAMLGDIIISVDKVREQAAEFGHSEKREFAFLIVHSMLHLFGYDHIEPEDAAIMEPKQKLILEELNILRENA